MVASLDSAPSARTTQAWHSPYVLTYRFMLVLYEASESQRKKVWTIHRRLHGFLGREGICSHIAGSPGGQQNKTVPTSRLVKVEADRMDDRRQCLCSCREVICACIRA